MQATKYSVNINVEALSLDSVPALVYEAIQQIDENESMAGTVIKDDGDASCGVRVVDEDEHGCTVHLEEAVWGGARSGVPADLQGRFREWRFGGME